MSNCEDLNSDTHLIDSSVKEGSEEVSMGENLTQYVNLDANNYTHLADDRTISGSELMISSDVNIDDDRLDDVDLMYPTAMARSLVRRASDCKVYTSDTSISHSSTSCDNNRFDEMRSIDDNNDVYSKKDIVSCSNNCNTACRQLVSSSVRAHSISLSPSSGRSNIGRSSLSSCETLPDVNVVDDIHGIKRNEVVNGPCIHQYGTCTPSDFATARSDVTDGIRSLQDDFTSTKSHYCRSIASTEGCGTYVPPVVHSNSVPLAVEASSNYLSLKGEATPRDRGDIEYITSSGLPAADLREAKGEVNREAVCRTNGGDEWNRRCSDMTYTGCTGKERHWTSSGMGSYGDNKPHIYNLPHNISNYSLPAADLREAEGQLNKEAVCKTTSGGTPSGIDDNARPLNGKTGIRFRRKREIDYDDKIVNKYKVDDNIYKDVCNRSREIKMRSMSHSNIFCDEMDIHPIKNL